MTKTAPLALALAVLGPALAVLWPALAAAAPNEGVFTYSGYLRTSAGAAETAAQSMTFALYDVASNGTAVWTQTLTVTPDSQGWFSAVLTPTPGLEAQLGNQLWLGVKVGSEAEMAPRTKLGSAPQALGVDWGGVLNRPAACSAGQYLTGYDPTTGAALCGTPAGGGGGVASVGGVGVISASPSTGAVVVSLTGCPGGSQILQWSGTAWQCIPTPTGGGGGVSSVSPDLGSGMVVSPTTGAVVASLRRDCGANQILKWTVAGGWGCAADDNSGGTVTGVGVSGGALTVAGTTALTIGLGAASGASSGYLTAADHVTFSGKAPSPGAGCNPGEVLTWTGAAFRCVADANSGGTVTSVTAAAASPITVGGTATAPIIGIAQASSAGPGALSAADWGTFSGKQNRVSGSCATGNYVTSIGADGSVTCEAVALTGDITGVAAGPGLTGGGIQGGVTLSSNFTAAGGANGTATTVARGDHNHAANAATRIISLPGTTLGRSPTSTTFTPTFSGMAWTLPGALDAVWISQRRPLDWNGSSTVTFRVWFLAPNGATGVVDMFVRAASVGTGGAAVNDVPGLTSTPVTLTGGSGIFGTSHEQAFTVPASSLSGAWWYLRIQNNTANTSFVGVITLAAVEFEYTPL